MKSVLFFLLFTNSVSAQTESLRIYEWADLQMQSELNPDTVFAINLSKQKLDSLPPKLFSFKNLTYLDLSKNRLTELPENITSFLHLETIILEKNKIDFFPLEFCRMTSLKTLILNRNNIEQIPSCIELLKGLIFIDLYDNPIRSLPEGLINLPLLKKIDLSGIRFSPAFQDAWHEKLPNVQLVFDAPCDCME